jgi:hypothetical protein
MISSLGTIPPTFTTTATSVHPPTAVLSTNAFTPDLYQVTGFLETIAFIFILKKNKTIRTSVHSRVTGKFL